VGAHRRPATGALAARLCGALAATLAIGAAPAAGGQAQLEALAAPAEMTIGEATTVRGHLAGSAAGSEVVLESAPYPFRRYATVARSTVQPDGSFVFAPLAADRNTRLRVSASGDPQTEPAQLSVTVDPRVKLSARSLGRGRTSLSVRVRHALPASAAPVQAWWFVQAHGSSVFTLAAVSSSRELPGGVLFASATVDPPSRRFAFRVCVNPPWEAAMGAAPAHGPCPRQDFVLRSGR
jgi:hypothetical protein